MQPLSSKPTSYFPALTGLRAIAAYLVFLYHYPLEFWIGRPATLFAFMREFHVGVTIFFALSGFLITFRYLTKSQLTGRFLRQYLLNRVARIYPVYFLLTTAQFLKDFQLPWPGYLMKEYFANITFLRGFSETLRFTGVQPGWSLTVEECFYLFAPLLFFALLRWPSNRAMVWLASSLLLAGMGAGLTYVLHGQPAGAFGSYDFTFNGTFFGRFSEFFIGAGLAIYLRAHPETTRWTARGYFTHLGLIGTGLIIACLALVHYFFLSNYPDRISTTNPIGFLLNGTVLPVFVCFLFYGLILEKTWLSALLSHPISEILGKSSYAFYLIHVSSLALLLHLNPHAGGGQYIGYFLGCLAVSLGIYYIIEEPANKWIRSLAKPSKAANV